MTKCIQPIPLTAESFAAFGQVIECAGAFDFEFNEGRADRWHDFVKTDCDENGRIGISLCISRPIILPYALKMMERHPLASQAFIPLDENPFIVFVAHDEGGMPIEPVAFITNGRQGINYGRNVWHGVLSPLDNEQRFVIIDRVSGEGNNLEVFDFELPLQVTS